MSHFNQDHTRQHYPPPQQQYMNSHQQQRLVGMENRQHYDPRADTSLRHVPGLMNQPPMDTNRFLGTPMNNALRVGDGRLNLDQQVTRPQQYDVRLMEPMNRSVGVEPRHLDRSLMPQHRGFNTHIDPSLERYNPNKPVGLPPAANSFEHFAVNNAQSRNPQPPQIPMQPQMGLQFMPKPSVTELVPIPIELAGFAAEPKFQQILLRVKEQTAINSISLNKVNEDQVESVVIDAPSKQSAILARNLIETHLKLQMKVKAAENRLQRVQTDLYSTQGEIASGQMVEFNVPPELLGLVIGKKGARIKQVEQETGVASINVRDNGHIMIYAPDASSVQRARELLELIDESLPLQQHHADWLGNKQNSATVTDLKNSSNLMVAKVNRDKSSLDVVGTASAIQAAKVLLATQLEYVDQQIKIEANEREAREKLTQVRKQYGINTIKSRDRQSESKADFPLASKGNQGMQRQIESRTVTVPSPVTTASSTATAPLPQAPTLSSVVIRDNSGGRISSNFESFSEFTLSQSIADIPRDEVSSGKESGESAKAGSNSMILDTKDLSSSAIDAALDGLISSLIVSEPAASKDVGSAGDKKNQKKNNKENSKEKQQQQQKKKEKNEGRSVTDLELNKEHLQANGEESKNQANANKNKQRNNKNKNTKNNNSAVESVLANDAKPEESGEAKAAGKPDTQNQQQSGRNKTKDNNKNSGNAGKNQDQHQPKDKTNNNNHNNQANKTNQTNNHQTNNSQNTGNVTPKQGAVTVTGHHLKESTSSLVIIPPTPSNNNHTSSSISAPNTTESNRGKGKKSEGNNQNNNNNSNKGQAQTTQKAANTEQSKESKGKLIKINHPFLKADKRAESNDQEHRGNEEEDNIPLPPAPVSKGPPKNPTAAVALPIATNNTANLPSNNATSSSSQAVADGTAAQSVNSANTTSNSNASGGNRNNRKDRSTLLSEVKIISIQSSDKELAANLTNLNLEGGATKNADNPVGNVNGNNKAIAVSAALGSALNSKRGRKQSKDSDASRTSVSADSFEPSVTRQDSNAAEKEQASQKSSPARKGKNKSVEHSESELKSANESAEKLPPPAISPKRSSAPPPGLLAPSVNQDNSANRTATENKTGTSEAAI